MFGFGFLNEFVRPPIKQFYVRKAKKRTSMWYSTLGGVLVGFWGSVEKRGKFWEGESARGEVALSNSRDLWFFFVFSAFGACFDVRIDFHCNHCNSTVESF